MNKLMLNSVPASVFNLSAADFDGSQERADIVMIGRSLMRDYAGKAANAMYVNSADKYTPYFTAETYAQSNEKNQRDVCLYCAKMVCNQDGSTPPKDMEEFRKQQRRFLSDRAFLKVLAGITRDVVTPVLPATYSDAVGMLAETRYVPFGQTLEIDIGSNDFFTFQDSSWGASRAVPANYLYTKTLTLNPQPKTAKATIKWYQLVGNNADMGAYYNAFAKGMYAYTMARWANEMTALANNNALVPAALKVTYSDANWAALADKLGAVNDTRNLFAVGSRVALSKVLPSGNVNGASVNLDSALTMLLGGEYQRMGYIGEKFGVRVLPLDNAIVPGTQNTTLSTVLPADTVWMMAAPGVGYKPLYIAYEEGTPITIELDPSETGDMTIDINVTMSIDVKPAVASKIGIVTVA